MEKKKILCYHTSVKITLMRDPIVPNRKGKNSMEQFFNYILAVNPSILSASGMDAGAVFTATALASAIASFLMAFLANLPFVLSAGMGLNAYFAYTVVLGMGYSWQMALTAVFVEGLIFVVLSLDLQRDPCNPQDRRIRRYRPLHYIHRSAERAHRRGQRYAGFCIFL